MSHAVALVGLVMAVVVVAAAARRLGLSAPLLLVAVVCRKVSPPSSVSSYQHRPPLLSMPTLTS